jgi:hypothetical protein
MTSLLSDIRYGLRVLSKNRGFTAVAVVSEIAPKIDFPLALRQGKV